MTSFGFISYKLSSFNPTVSLNQSHVFWMANYERTGLTAQPYFLPFSFILPCILSPYSSENALAKDTHTHTVAQFRNFSSQSSSYSTWLHPLNPGFLKSFPPLSFGITFSSGSSPLHLKTLSTFSACQPHDLSLSCQHPEFCSWFIFFVPSTCLSGVLILSDSFKYQLYTAAAESLKTSKSICRHPTVLLTYKGPDLSFSISKSIH